MYITVLLYFEKTFYLIWKVLWVGRCETDPHVWIDERHAVQQVGEAQASLAGPIHSVEATAELGRL